MSTKKKRIISAVAVLIIIIGLIVPGFYNGLKVQHYAIKTDELDHSLRIAFVADLHSCQFGENEQILIDAINEQKPDIVLLGGDIFDDQLPDDNAEMLLVGISERYPCYYVTGNHEYWDGEEAFDKKMTILEKHGVVRLADESMTISICGEQLTIYGADDPDAERLSSTATGRIKTPSEKASDLKAFGSEDGYTILLIHRPGSVHFYAECGIDLALCGHTHGGLWRIPGLLNGLYAPDQGFFPQYTGGQYEDNGSVMIVSRGLARESTRIPRFYNRPELVIVDILGTRSA